MAVVYRKRLLLFVVGIWLFSACSPRAPIRVVVQPSVIPRPTETSKVTAPGIPVNVIPLAGPVAARDSEISSLAWYGDHLIILPQYPHRISTGGDGVLFALSKAEITAYLDGKISDPLEASEIPFLAPGLEEAIKGFEGFEAIAFVGDRVFVTVETKTAGGMRGYLVAGTIAPDLTALTLDANLLAEIQPQSGINNLSEESLIAAGESLMTIYEANGVQVNRRIPWPRSPAKTRRAVSTCV
jgi:hypothetical protein